MPGRVGISCLKRHPDSSHYLSLQSQLGQILSSPWVLPIEAKKRHCVLLLSVLRGVTIVEEVVTI